MASGGWIKLFRKITEWEWYRDGNTFRVFVHLLVTANHEPKKWRGVMVSRGQVVTGRNALSKSLTLSDRQVRTALDHLKSTNEISIKTTNKFSLITIVNYEEYQRKDDENDQQNDQQLDTQATSKQPANDQQTTTNKNTRTKECKKDKEDKKVYGELAHVQLTDDEYQKLIRDFGQAVTQEYINQLDYYIGSKGKRYKSHYATIRQWVSRDVKDGKVGKKPSSGNQFADWVRDQEEA